MILHYYYTYRDNDLCFKKTRCSETFGDMKTAYYQLFCNQRNALPTNRESLRCVSSHNKKAIIIFIRNENGETIILDVSLDDSIEDVKKKIQQRTAIPAVTQRLKTFKWEQLISGILSDYDVKVDSEMNDMNNFLWLDTSSNSNDNEFKMNDIIDMNSILNAMVFKNLSSVSTK